MRRSNNYFPLLNYDGALVSYTHVEIIESGNGKIKKIYYPSKNYLTHATKVNWARAYTRGYMMLDNDIEEYVVLNFRKQIDLRDYNLSDTSALVNVNLYEFVDGSKWKPNGIIGPLDYYFNYNNDLIRYRGPVSGPGSESLVIINDERGGVPLAEIQKEGYNIFPFPTISDDGNVNTGKLKEVKFFKEGDFDHPIKEVSYTYSAVGTPVTVNGLIYRTVYACNTTLTPLPYEKSWKEYSYNVQYFIQRNLHMYIMPKTWAKYKYIANQSYLMKSEVITKNNEFEKAIEYQYNNELLQSQIMELDSKNNSIITTYKYPKDYTYLNGSIPLSNMVDQHIISPVIEKKVYINKMGKEKLISAELMEYKMDEGLIVPSTLHSFNSNNGVTDFTAAQLPNSGVLVYDTRYTTEASFDNYDEYGNLLQVTPKSEIKESFEWGYNNSVPIVKIINAKNTSYYEPSVATKTIDAGETTNSTDLTTFYAGDISFDMIVTGPPTKSFTIGITLENSDRSYYRSLCLDLGTGFCNSLDKVTLEDVPAGDYTLRITTQNEGTPITVFADLKCSYPGKRLSGVKEFFFESFEENPEASHTITNAHTGKARYIGSSYSVNWTRPNSRNYIITYWYSSGGIWHYSGEIPYTTSSYTLTGGSAYDDIRIYPEDAKMTTYTYDPLIGITSVSDENSLPAFYKYDDFGRLNTIKDHEGSIIKLYEYNYKIK